MEELNHEWLNHEWFYEERFWQTFAPVMFDARRMAEPSEVADGVIHLADLDLYRTDMPDTPAPNAPPRLLDLCCGFGRMALEFARRGFAVTGVDITGFYLDAARRGAAREALDAEFIQEDARAFTRPGFFDIAVNLYISFGYFENEADDARVARNVCESLKTGGVFIIETLGKEIAARDFVKREWFPKGDFTVLTEYAIQGAWDRLQNRWIMMKDGKTFERVFSQRLYSARELRSLLANAGFSRVDFYGGWDGEPYNEDATRLIAVARKQPYPD
jgi:SAM-dependent methyltransferase